MRRVRRFLEVLSSGLRILWQTTRMASRAGQRSRPPTNSNATNYFILSLAEAIYVRYEILSQLAESRMKAVKHERDIMSKTVTHLAGPPVGIHTKDDKDVIRIIQRCMVCGEKLLEKKIHKNRQRRASTWDVSSWLEQQEDGTYHSILQSDDSEYGCTPPNTCSALVEEDDDVEVLMPDEDDEDDNEE